MITSRPPYKGCRSKVAFESRDEARLALARMWRNPQRVLANYARTGKIPCRAYECPFCGKWHLTSRPAREPEQPAQAQEGAVA